MPLSSSPVYGEVEVAVAIEVGPGEIGVADTPEIRVPCVVHLGHVRGQKTLPFLRPGVVGVEPQTAEIVRIPAGDGGIEIAVRIEIRPPCVSEIDPDKPL